MILPSIEEIKNTISIPRNILIDKLDGYAPLPGLLGPEQYPGGFSIVFPFTNGTDKKALRIWHKEIPEIKKRTAQISSYLSQNAQLEYFINYEYFSNAIRFDSGIKLDAVLMDWGAGLTLKDYIDNLIHSGADVSTKSNKIIELAKSFYKLFTDLHKANISHGDMQHGNILVTDSSCIKLIDYDSLFVPTMGNRVSQVTSGLSGYQHPLRPTSAYSTEKNDYFSELIIITSLIYISEDLKVWDEFSVMDDEYSFLFNTIDYSDFANSKVFRRGMAKSNLLRQLLNEIQCALKVTNLESLSPIENIIEKVGLNWNTYFAGLYCINCGSQFALDDNYCINCGIKRI